MPVAAAMAGFIAISILIGSALAGAGGWRELAAQYPGNAIPPPDEERFRFASLRTAGGLVGTATYNSCVIVGVSARGISLELWAPFRLFHPPVFIPWAAVEACRAVEFPGRTWAHFTVRHGGSVTVAGRAGAAIRQRASELGLPASTG